MRKTGFFLAATLMLVFLWSHPGSAFQAKLGMRIVTEIGYVFRTGSSYFNVGGMNDRRQPDLTTFETGMPVTNYIGALFTNNDKTVGVRVEIGGGASAIHGNNVVILRHLYGWYKFGRCKLVVGHTSNLLASLQYAPYQWLGSAFGLGGTGFLGNQGPNYNFIGFGKQFSGRFVQIALYYNIGSWTFMIAIGQPSANNVVNWGAVGAPLPIAPLLGQLFGFEFGGGPFTPNLPAYGGQAFVSNTVWPRIDLVVQYKSKYFSIAPGFSFYQSQFEPLAGVPLRTDRVNSFLLVLPYRITLGRLIIKGEFAYGMNWDTTEYPLFQRLLQRAVWWGGNNDLTPLDSVIMDKVENTFLYAAVLGLEYYIGRTSLHFGAGWVTIRNASNDQVGTWRHGQNTRYGFNFAVRYRVNRHFTISPEVSYWFFGWNPLFDVGSPNRGTLYADLGSAWLAGILFEFSF